MFIDDTIAAIATATGEGGIGIIRISGMQSLEIAKKVFRSISNKQPEEYPRTLCYGHIVKDNTVLDEVLTVYMPAPHTYTKEDIVEIQCHGGMIATKMILEWVLENGARMAEHGEFTNRAFLNGCHRQKQSKTSFPHRRQKAFLLPKTSCKAAFPTK